MELATIVMEPGEAEAKLAEYRKLAPSRLTPEDLATMAGYGALAAGNAVIDLTAAMRAAGLDEKGLPRLAIARADQRQVGFRREMAGAGVFDCRRQFGGRGRRPSVELPRGTWTFPDRGAWEGRAYAPTIPPEHRPALSQFRRYHVLWEAVWRPSPPGDPFLLKHLTETLYIVLAQWDLTLLEQAVLQGRIRGEGN